jgi:hypothetical protein
MNDNSKKEKAPVNERPRICCIDIEKNVTESLIDLGFNIYTGTLGSKIRVPNINHNNNHQLLLNCEIPENLHEYDIIILDLDINKIIDYKKEEHIRVNHTGKSALSLLCSYPETIFDPRPLGSSSLNRSLRQLGNRPHIVITFTTAAYDIEYEVVKITEGRVSRERIEKYNIYSFTNYIPLAESKCGKEITICNIREDLRNLFELTIKKTTYNQTFHHPTKWENGKHMPDPHYIPLLKNSSGDIVSIYEFNEYSYIFYLPRIELKEEFLGTFLSKIAPDLLPELFPFSTTFKWKEKEEYWLPKHKNLLDEKKKIEAEYYEKINLKEEEISRNTKKFYFLHEIITETGDKLVDSLIQYLKWLGFKNVTKVDEENTENNLLGEDIQVELENGLLIIECKGIGGTSTDPDCSQISKIKHRRCKERNRFDVYALYIVNHQRYLPPLNRQNPPFTPVQMQDAVNDERGLLSTWQLFNLYFEIENGIIEKDSSRNELLKFGFVEFKPKNLILIDKPKEIFKNGIVCIVNISKVDLSVGDEILVEKSGKFQNTIIEGIQIDDKPVTTANSGEIGLQLSIPIKKKSVLWKKASK